MQGPKPNSIPIAPNIMPNGTTGIIKDKHRKNLVKNFLFLLTLIIFVN